MSTTVEVIHRHYRTCRFGDLHVRVLDARDQVSGPPLLCLHPAPYSGAWYTTVMPMLNNGRAVIAPDYPGYGGSVPTPELPSIDDYALSMLDMLDAMSIACVDVLGFHTGCLVAIEMALRERTKIGELVLIDVPFFSATERSEMHASVATPRTLSGELASLAGDWDSKVTQRLDAMSFDRAFELFVESLRAADRSHWGFHAAFTYPSDERLPRVDHRTHVIATQSGLLEPTRRAARALNDSDLVERLDIKRAVFEEGAEKIAAEIGKALTGDALTGNGRE